ncbi:hypothetical protein MNV49_001537 [Pseudohyphozyma bogoriensis]|nr:hypothetical protein MNV49_001537 [Pseudohyphozyma bogoriensis]
MARRPTPMRYGLYLAIVVGLVWYYSRKSASVASSSTPISPPSKWKAGVDALGGMGIRPAAQNPKKKIPFGDPAAVDRAAEAKALGFKEAKPGDKAKWIPVPKVDDDDDGLAGRDRDDKVIPPPQRIMAPPGKEIAQPGKPQVKAKDDAAAGNLRDKLKEKAAPRPKPVAPVAVDVKMKKVPKPVAAVKDEDADYEELSDKVDKLPPILTEDELEAAADDATAATAGDEVDDDGLNDLDDEQSNRKAKGGPKARPGAPAGRVVRPKPIGAAVKPARPIPPVAPAEDAKKWEGNVGWSQRFKQKPGAADAAAAADTDDDSDAADGTKGKPLKGVLAHPLVARLAAFDLGRSTPTGQEDSFQAQPAAVAADDEDAVPLKEPKQARPRVKLNKSAEKFNITLCALIPSEGRFLPEWLLYHRSLGVERFALYDTSAAGAVGGEEVDTVADLLEAEGKGEMAPSAEEIKARIGRTANGLDSDGKVFPERIQGLERWIEQGTVVYHWMKFKDTKGARKFHEDMLRHCTETYSKTSGWLGAIDVDEFLVMSESLYGENEPFKTSETETTWQYPLHDLLERETLKDAACMPVPQLRYRNVGVRTLAPGQGVLTTQTKRDVVQHGTLPEKTLIHTAFSSGFVNFDGPHSCRVSDKVEIPTGLTNEIRDSQGDTLQKGGAYKPARLPTEPLSIAHFFQRDLTDCHEKLAALDDPNSLHAKGRGTVLCEEHYLPSPEELASPEFVNNEQNRFLVRVPEEGSVVEDLRVRDSWAAKAAGAVLKVWKAKGPPSLQLVESARDRVELLLF